MNHCDFHPERVSVGTCPNCGKLMCAECYDNTGGSELCPNCRGEAFHSGNTDTWESGPSPWDTSGFMDGGTRTYLKLGMFGFLLGIAVWGINILHISAYVSNDYLLLASLSLLGLIINVPTGFLIAAGFLGLYHKYSNSPSKIAGIMRVIATLWGMFAVFVGMLGIAYDLIIVLAMVTSGIGLIGAILIGYALWTIRERSVSPTVTMALSIMWIVGVFGNIIPSFIIYGLFLMALYLLMAYFFYGEQTGEVRKITSTW